MDLAGDDLLIRGGLCADIEQMIEQVEANYEDDGRYSLSFFGSPTRSVVDVCKDYIPNGKVRSVSVRTLLDAGLEIEKTDGPDREREDAGLLLDHGLGQDCRDPHRVCHDATIGERHHAHERRLLNR